MRYALGITAAIVAGLAFNIGLLIQKSAVGRAPRDRPLMRSLLKSPVWIAGFALQFILGSPLYTLSVGLIGPAIVPGLMSVGLVVLALGAVLIQKERLAPKEIVGTGLVVVAVALFGFSRLSIDVHAVSLKDPGLLLRAGMFAGVLLAIALGCAEAARRLSAAAARGSGSATAEVPAAAAAPTERPAALHATRAGVWYNIGNLGLGFITAGLARFGTGIFDAGEIAVFLSAVGLTVGGNMYGIAATQHALTGGRASVVVPLQNAVTQVLPVFVFFLVYRPYVPTAASLVFLGAAGALLLTGAVLLTGRMAAKERGASPL
jgi:hypothetical protein